MHLAALRCRVLFIALETVRWKVHWAEMWHILCVTFVGKIFAPINAWLVALAMCAEVLASRQVKYPIFCALLNNTGMCQIFWQNLPT
jgi:hypothetical protein